MDVKCQPYTGSFWVRGEYHGTFVASLQSNLTDEVFGSVEIASKAVAAEWVEHEFVLVPEKDAPSTNNTFAVLFDPKVSMIDPSMLEGGSMTDCDAGRQGGLSGLQLDQPIPADIQGSQEWSED